MQEPPPEQGTNPSQNQSTNKSQEVVAKIKELVVVIRKITRNLKAATKENLSNTKVSLEANQSSSSSLTNRICSRWTRLRCKNFWSMCYPCMVLTSLLQQVKETIHSRMLSVDFRICLVRLEAAEEEPPVVEAEAVEHKVATHVEVVLKEVVTTEVATKSKTTGTILIKVLKYSNNQTYLVNL